ncbi:hypothetical protein I4U23_010318 [Adineta vaga]|nr:hypothetical protein I4U23_010318 [Adineta vaga]
MSTITVTTDAGIQMPRLIYGTAWKKEATTSLVTKAILNGFRGIDTACEPKHYSEDLVGQALLEFQTKHNISILHSPLQSHAINMQVYREFEKFVHDGRVKQLGISNLYDLNGLKRLYKDARHKPSVIQNRFYAETNFDNDIRQFCRENNIVYQSFWTLTANPEILNHSLIKQLAQESHDIDLTPLTGTTNEQHMKEDLEILQWSSSNYEPIEKLQKLIHE